MSDALQTTNEIEVTEAPLVSKRHVLMDKLTTKITLYSGVMPLSMIFEAMVEEVVDDQLNSKWYATLHLTGIGSAQNVFMSNTVQIQPGVVTPVTFPPTSFAVGSSGYGLQSIGTGPASTSVTAMVKLTLPTPPNTDPTLTILNTTVDAQWVIGAIDILITDPPVIMEIKA